MAVPEDYDGPTFEYEGERYPFDPTTMLGSQVKLLKSRTGMSFIKYVEDVEELGAESIGFYIWLTLTEQGKEPGKYSDFDFVYTDWLEGLKGFEDEKPDPTPPPNRAARRKATKKTTKTSSGGGRPSSPTTAESPPTGS